MEGERETDGGMKGGQEREKINCGFSWEHNLGKCMQPTADNMIILGGKKKQNKTKQNKTKNPTSPHYAKEDVRGVLSSMQALIQQYLLDAMLIFFLFSFFFYLCRQLKKY